MPNAEDLTAHSIDLRCRVHLGVMEIPVHYMRGGTSTGVVIWEPLLPKDEALRDELLRHLMGVPQAGEAPGNRQIAGLGRGPATSNKVFLARVEQTPAGPRLVSTLAQLASGHAGIDWSVNCGNMSSALPLWAFDSAMIEAPKKGACEVEIFNSNTGVVTLSRMWRGDDGRFALADIPGVLGAFPRVDLFLQDPVGSKTGVLLPTGAVVDEIEGHEVSCVDVAVPMVIAKAASFGKTGHESIAELEGDAAFMAELRKVWVAAGLKMKLRRRDGELMTRAEIERSETIPKVCIVGAPTEGGNITVRYFTPQTGHASMAVSGGCCLAAACLLPGSTAHQVAQRVSAPGATFGDIEVSIENPAGKLDATVTARCVEQRIEIQAAAYRRSTQILLRGHVPLYGASAALLDALIGAL
ncbi:PrpF domain-containing protein [Pseudomonas sp. DTU_2021_1001937_2_SI_NGA_ILE_001]|uniref:PrpF domain-containing protein n=1 Tax=Pseudomonas sp. DTU_2021_1001937_2_SI_NGA_ILE_001 TaxID=3077589 RepID=UPI0028FC2D85|nr:PrpF domain-containing protein [Pseudomonas sp. DTU_2021_1001937_2_SI_NGA_ILE_001]WNW11269.1 PrpF domain-containing protein [Pseudomonas sp. DTU_2021_1001937_2_SI_NGA_ILE_001]